MKMGIRWWLALALVGLVLPTIGLAGSGATPRPLSDFLSAQGSSSSFFAPVPDYVGWVGADIETFALVDYAGLAGAWIEAQTETTFPTHVGGQVKERGPDDGPVEVTVKLRTANALSFAQSVADLIASGFDFLGTATNFGEKAQSVALGATPATGWAHLDTTFTMPTAGATLPDFLDIINTVDYAPATFVFKSQAIGLRPDGTRARLRVHQVASTVYADGAWSWVYTVEIADLEDLGG